MQEHSNFNQKKRKKWPILLALFFLALFIAGGFLIWVKAETDKPNSEDATTQAFVVKPGQGGGDIISNLKKEGLVRNHFVMLFYLNWHRLGDKLLAGEYQIPKNLNVKQIAELLTRGQVITSKITIPEGWRVDQIDKEYSKVSGQPSGSFIQAAVMKKEYKKYWFLQGVTEGESLEGYMYPDTYQLKKKSKADDLVVLMLDNLKKKMDKNYATLAAKKNLTVTELFSLASIVEREVAKPEDRKLVAGVFLNRLEIGMALESCATIQYILKSNKTIFTIEETRTPSPYNTYTNRGLPPRPIGNPSLDSIKAVLNPTESSYLYFLSSEGKTYFSKTLEEHNQKKAIYLGG